MLALGQTSYPICPACPRTLPCLLGISLATAITKIFWEIGISDNRPINLTGRGNVPPTHHSLAGKAVKSDQANFYGTFENTPQSLIRALQLRKFPFFLKTDGATLTRYYKKTEKDLIAEFRQILANSQRPLDRFVMELKRGQCLYLRDENGDSLLYRAIREKRPDLAKPLIDLGVPLEQVDTGKRLNALGAAAIWNGPEIVEKLLLGGIDIENSGISGMSPLMISLILGYTELQELFVKKGADINTELSYGKTALHIAIEAGRPDWVAIFVKAGGDPFQNHSPRGPFFSPYGKLAHEGSSANVGLIKALLGIDGHPAFGKCSTIHDLFNVLFPPIDPLIDKEVSDGLDYDEFLRDCYTGIIDREEYVQGMLSLLHKGKISFLSDEIAESYRRFWDMNYSESYFKKQEGWLSCRLEALEADCDWLEADVIAGG